MKLMFHERDMRVIYSVMTVRQPVIYWATNHLLARLCFDSIDARIDEFQILVIFRHYMKRNTAKNIDCNGGVYMYIIGFLRRENDATPSNVMKITIDVTKQIKMTSR